MDLSNPEAQQELIKSLYALNNAIANSIKRGDTSLKPFVLVMDSIEIKNKLDQLPEPELKKLLQLNATTNANSRTE